MNASYLNLLIALLENRLSDARDLFREGGQKFPNEALSRIQSGIENIKARVTQEVLNKIFLHTMRMDPDLPEAEKKGYLAAVTEIEQFIQGLYEN